MVSYSDLRVLLKRRHKTLGTVSLVCYAPKGYFVCGKQVVLFLLSVLYLGIHVNCGAEPAA